MVCPGWRSQLSVNIMEILMESSPCCFLLCLLSWLASALASRDLDLVKVPATRGTAFYCTPTSALPACIYQGFSYPGKSAVDTLLRSRLSNGSSEWDDSLSDELSVNPSVPGVVPDARMMQSGENVYLAYKSAYRVRAQLDYFLCSDQTCEQMVDLFWNKPPSGQSARVMSRFSWLQGTPYALPLWAPGAFQPPQECKLVSGTSSLLLKKGTTLEVCSWGIDSLQVFKGKALPSVVNIAYAARALVDRLGRRVRVSHGRFMTSAGICITLILPVGDRMREWGWTAHHDCKNPQGVYLFDSYFMLAFANPNATLRSGAGINTPQPPTTSPAALLSNAEAWLNAETVSYSTRGRRTLCLQHSPLLRTEDCSASTPSRFDSERAATRENTLTESVVVIEGKPILVLNLPKSLDQTSFDWYAESKENGTLADSGDVAREIFRVGAGMVNGDSEPWCAVNASGEIDSVSFADSNGGGPFDIYDCSKTIPMGLLNVALKGPALEDISSVAVAATVENDAGVSTSTSLGFAGRGVVASRDVEDAINTTLARASRVLGDQLDRVLSAADLVATGSGAFFVLLVAVISTFGIVVGLEDVFEMSRRFFGGSGLAAAVLVVLIIGAAALYPPVLFLIQEQSARANNEQAPSVFWTNVPVYATAGNPVTSVAKYSVATGVVVSYEALSSSFTYTAAWLAIAAGVVSTLFAAVKAWFLVRERPMPATLANFAGALSAPFAALRSSPSLWWQRLRSRSTSTTPQPRSVARQLSARRQPPSAEGDPGLLVRPRDSESGL